MVYGGFHSRNDNGVTRGGSPGKTGGATGKQVVTAVAALYLMSAIVAFGHAAAERYREDTVELQQCRRDTKRLCFDDRSPRAAMSGLAAGLLWPLHLSWVAFS